MAKQFSTFYISWRDAKKRPLGLFADESSYGKAASSALEAKLNELGADGWIVDRIIPATGFTPRQCAAYTVVVFK